MTFDKPPHAVMHFGMTGWMKFDSEDTHYYKQAKEKDGSEAEQWPPKYMKFLLKCGNESVDNEERGPVEAAFVDARRLARIRLVDCPADEIREHTPLKENGPDPVRDKDTVTVEWLGQLLGKKRVPVKALLLDQANLSGVGNWVADEVLYQARIHPEQYSNTLSKDQTKELHDALIGVCTTAVETLAESSQFPETWIMKYRWDKGKKDGNVLPNGEKIVHLKVGGRTSAIVPSRQKKTAAVAGDVSDDDGVEQDEKPAKGRKRKSKDEDDAVDGEEEKPVAKKGKGGRKAKPDGQAEQETKPAKGSKGQKANIEDDEQVDAGAEDGEDAKVEKEKPKTTGRAKKAGSKKEEKPATPGTRRSTRTKSS